MWNIWGDLFAFCLINVLNGTFVENIDCGQSTMRVKADDPCLKLQAVSRYGTKVGSTIEYACASLLSSLAEARAAYCPVQICLANGTWSKVSMSCAKSECYHPRASKEYRGSRSCTASGVLCQPWNKQYPHKHIYDKDEYFPDENVTLAARSCRDPLGVMGQPWCYTMASHIEWEFCNVRKCDGIPINEGHCNNGTSVQGCGLPNLDINADSACTQLEEIPVLSTTIGATIKYSCRSFLTSLSSQRNYCPVETCQHNGQWTKGQISCASNECYHRGKSHLYNGLRNCTATGRPCVSWEIVGFNIGMNMGAGDSQTVWGAYCRDPRGLMGQPYCFLDVAGTVWEFCSIQICEDHEQKEGECSPDEMDITTRADVGGITWITANKSTPTQPSIKSQRTTTEYYAESTTKEYGTKSLRTTKRYDTKSEITTTGQNENTSKNGSIRNRYMSTEYNIRKENTTREYVVQSESTTEHKTESKSTAIQHIGEIESTTRKYYAKSESTTKENIVERNDTTTKYKTESENAVTRNKSENACTIEGHNVGCKSTMVTQNAESESRTTRQSTQIEKTTRRNNIHKHNTHEKVVTYRQIVTKPSSLESSRNTAPLIIDCARLCSHTEDCVHYELDTLTLECRIMSTNDQWACHPQKLCYGRV